MSQSDITNSHPLMRPIYCRHQQEREGGGREGQDERRRGPAQKKEINKRK